MELWWYWTVFVQHTSLPDPEKAKEQKVGAMTPLRGGCSHTASGRLPLASRPHPALVASSSPQSALLYSGLVCGLSLFSTGTPSCFLCTVPWSCQGGTAQNPLLPEEACPSSTSQAHSCPCPVEVTHHMSFGTHQPADTHRDGEMAPGLLNYSFFSHAPAPLLSELRPPFHNHGSHKCTGEGGAMWGPSSRTHTM